MAARSDSLGVSQSTIAEISKELVRTVLSPEERALFLRKQKTHGSMVRTRHEDSFRCRGCGDQVKFSDGCGECGLCPDCCICRGTQEG